MATQKQGSTRTLVFDTIRRGKRQSSLSMTLVSKQINPRTPSMFFFIVPKTVSKKATERNLLKRRGRHITRRIAGHIVPSHTIIFYFKKGVARLSFSELEQEMTTLLQKGKLYV